MPLLEPVILSVSASISARTSSKSTNFFPLQCKNSAYSTRKIYTKKRQGETCWNKRAGYIKEMIGTTEQTISIVFKNGDRHLAVAQAPGFSPALLLTSCKMRGLRVTMPDPRGRKSLITTKRKEKVKTRTCEDQRQLWNKKLLHRFHRVTSN